MIRPHITLCGLRAVSVGRLGSTNGLKGTRMKPTGEIGFKYHNKLSAFIRARVARDVAEDMLQDVF